MGAREQRSPTLSTALITAPWNWLLYTTDRQTALSVSAPFFCVEAGTCEFQLIPHTNSAVATAHWRPLFILRRLQEAATTGSSRSLPTMAARFAMPLESAATGPVCSIQTTAESR